jgi:hypothetical protein
VSCFDPISRACPTSWTPFQFRARDGDSISWLRYTGPGIHRGSFPLFTRWGDGQIFSSFDGGGGSFRGYIHRSCSPGAYAVRPRIRSCGHAERANNYGGRAVGRLAVCLTLLGICLSLVCPTLSVFTPSPFGVVPVNPYGYCFRVWILFPRLRVYRFCPIRSIKKEDS